MEPIVRRLPKMRSNSWSIRFIQKVDNLSSEEPELFSIAAACVWFKERLHFLILTFFFVVFAFKILHSNRLSLSQERNASNPGYQRFQGTFQGQRLQPYLEIPEDGLADFFVIKHTRDEVLARDLLSKYGFKAADATQVGIISNNWNWTMKSAGRYILQGGRMKKSRREKCHVVLYLRPGV